MPIRLLLAAAVAAALAPVPGTAQEAQDAVAAPQQVAQSPTIGIELNALRQVGDGCQAYFVVRNHAPAPLSALELDAFMFDADGIIVDRLALPFPPVDAGRMKVMVFDLGLACATVARVFVNDVLSCETGEGTCADRLALSSRADAELAN